MKRNGLKSLMLGALVTASLAIFLVGCGTAPTAVEGPDQQQTVDMQAQPDGWW